MRRQAQQAPKQQLHLFSVAFKHSHFLLGTDASWPPTSRPTSQGRPDEFVFDTHRCSDRRVVSGERRQCAGQWPRDHVAFEACYRITYYYGDDAEARQPHAQLCGLPAQEGQMRQSLPLRSLHQVRPGMPLSATGPPRQEGQEEYHSPTCHAGRSSRTQGSRISCPGSPYRPTRIRPPLGCQ